MKNEFLSTYTGILILINVIVFLLSLIFLNIYGETFLKLFAIVPNLFFEGRIWTAFTSMFLHDAGGSIISIHLLANMISLFFVGTFVERLIGKRRFLIIYLVSGIFAAIFYATLSFYFGNSIIGIKLFGSSKMIALGASGAIFGLIGLIAVLTPKNKIYLIAGPLIALILQAILGKVFANYSWMSIIDLLVIVYFIFSIYSIFSFNPKLKKYAFPIEMPFYLLPIFAIVPLVLIGLFVVDLPIGNSAHLGGLIAGMIYGFYLKKKYPRKTKMISHYFSR
ncbi:MAG: rhomboid family intramembrane serine protease [Candidatus Pacearchaeota archaeon]